MANFTTLYSGSSGNCAYIEEDGAYLLVDMGRSARYTNNALKSIGATPENLAGILVTHEHSDHIAGLAVFLKKCNVPVYASAKTLAYLVEHNCVPAHTPLIAMDGTPTAVGDFSVQSFSTSHDAVDCCGYRITTKSGKVASIATDLGYVSDEVFANLHQADLVSLEANYDEAMLMAGFYPYTLKRRVASHKGHLCNEDSASTLVMLLQQGCKKFALCHLSSDNNSPALVLQTVRSALLSQGIVPNEDCVVQTAHRHEVSPMIEF